MFLHRYGHAWLAWLLTSCAFRARTRMMHSQYQHVCALFFGEGRFFVVLVLLHANPPDGFCSVLLCRPHLPHGARPVCWLFILCVALAPHTGIHRLGFTLRVRTYGLSANGATRLRFSYPCFGRCSRGTTIFW